MPQIPIDEFAHTATAVATDPATLLLLGLAAWIGFLKVVFSS